MTPPLCASCWLIKVNRLCRLRSLFSSSQAPPGPPLHFEICLSSLSSPCQPPSGIWACDQTLAVRITEVGYFSLLGHPMQHLRQCPLTSLVLCPLPQEVYRLHTLLPSGLAGPPRSPYPDFCFLSLIISSTPPHRSFPPLLTYP